jgi:hypothetical protein
VKLLLDEMVSAVVAERLRARGRDVEAVSERRELRGLIDEELFEYAQEAERAVVTYNRDDFLELDRRYRGRDRSHAGIVILNPRRAPRFRKALLRRGLLLFRSRSRGGLVGPQRALAAHSPPKRAPGQAP